MDSQPYSFHTLPAVFMLEAQLSESMVGTLNDYLDKLMVDESRESHAGTLVGQISHGQQLTMDHHCEELQDFNWLRFKGWQWTTLSSFALHLVIH